jgi:hypothetical protein
MVHDGALREAAMGVRLYKKAFGEAFDVFFLYHK